MDAAERELFGTSLAQVTAQHTGEALDAALAEIGWEDALSADPRDAVPALFEHQGATNSTSSALDRVMLAALRPGLVEDGGGAGGWTDGRGGHGVGLVLPALGHGTPPGDGSEEAGARISVRGLATAGVRRSSQMVVVGATRGGVGGPGDVFTALVATGDLALRRVRGLDPTLGLVEVAGDAVPVVSSLDPSPAAASAAWRDAVVAGQRALAHELVGASRAMLDLARDHAQNRVQFGRPIAAFQAVRHRLADSLVAIEAADAAATAAWDDGSPLAAALAKAIAGRGARTVARHCQQVLAGIGFTTEHPLHRYVRRVLVLDQLLGDARSLTRQIGEDLLDTRRLPAMLPL